MNTGLSKTERREVETKAKVVVQSMHHVSYRCYDPEETRRYYEDFLGLEFSAAIPSTVDIAGTPVECLLMLFRMAKGDFISFYHVPSSDKRDIYKPLGPLDQHLGMKVSSKAEWLWWVDRFTTAGIEFIGPLNHEFIESIYFWDPNGLILEITYELDNHEEFMEDEKSHARSVIDNWTVQTARVKSERRRSKAADQH